MTEHLTCRVTQKLLQLYVDGDLRTSDATAVEEHVAACHDCRRQFTALKRTVLLLESLPYEPAPAFSLARTMAAVRRDRDRRRSVSGWWVTGTLVAAVLSVAAVSAVLLDTNETLLSAIDLLFDDPGEFLEQLMEASATVEMPALLALAGSMVMCAVALYHTVRREFGAATA